jgi:hypothetical protein
VPRPSLVRQNGQGPPGDLPRLRLLGHAAKVGTESVIQCTLVDPLSLKFVLIELYMTSDVKEIFRLQKRIIRIIANSYGIVLV